MPNPAVVTRQGCMKGPSYERTPSPHHHLLLDYADTLLTKPFVVKWRCTIVVAYVQKRVLLLHKVTDKF